MAGASTMLADTLFIFLQLLFHGGEQIGTDHGGHWNRDALVDFGPVDGMRLAWMFRPAFAGTKPWPARTKTRLAILGQAHVSPVFDKGMDGVATPRPA